MNRFYERLAERVSKLCGRKLVFYRNAEPYGNVIARFEGISTADWMDELKITHVKPCEIESACKVILESYFIVARNASYRRWIWLEENHLEHLRSESFQELDVKLSLMGV